MTKNLTSTSETLPAAMELDLDSFLNSPLTSDDDDDNDKDNHHSLNSIPHRTIDEILNASVSSTSSPPTSPPSVYSRVSDPKHDQDDTVSVSTTKQPSSDFSSIPLQAQHDENPSLQLFSRVRPGINYPDDPFKRLSNSKPLPSLFRGQRLRRQWQPPGLSRRRTPPRSSRGGPPVEASRRARILSEENQR
ncbi:hypothetical protein CMV_021096 [Castanea mollissima]|uniref:Uncharacterized protein n=1 Tax=Castanea mollissima TaxID=60419 RepID=A0A8J4VKY7_9ROSI|nr:hypothetical protein CMV_021096 [Castanea mollissima]